MAKEQTTRLPCPFCGSLSSYRSASTVRSFKCAICCCTGPKAPTADEAEAYWNRRPATAENVQEEDKLYVRH